MYNLRVILLINFIIAIHVPNTETKETLYYESITEQKAADSLIEIQANQILPFVQMLNHTNMELQHPESLEKVFTDRGRIINGTRFTSKNKAEQLLFCPKENSVEYCLVPKEFQGLEPLQCSKEPTPYVREEQNQILCGPHDSGKTYNVVYEICPVEETKDYKNKLITLYTFCYDSINGKTIFTSHVIVFPELLDSEVLRHEHNVKHNMIIIYGMTPLNFLQLEESNSLNTESQHHSKDQEPKKNVYKMQKFTPPEDMAFASWRKSTYRYFNAELQHEALIPLWNRINDHIRNQAKKMYVTEAVQFYISTLVVDLTSTPGEDGQKLNMWVKLIHAMPLPGTNTETPIRGLAILMNNFIDNVIEHTTSSKSTEKSVIDCKDDFCEDTLKKDFEKVGGRVRCCSINDEIDKLFRSEDEEMLDDFDIPLLRIPGINELDENLSDENQSEESYEYV